MFLTFGCLPCSAQPFDIVLLCFVAFLDGFFSGGFLLSFSFLQCSDHVLCVADVLCASEAVNAGIGGFNTVFSGVNFVEVAGNFLCFIESVHVLNALAGSFQTS